MPLKITIVSDSTYTVQGHGVHTAFTQHVRALRALPDVQIKINGLSLKSDVTHIHTFGPIGVYHALFGHGKTIISAHVVPDSLVGSIIGAKFWLPLARAFLRWFYNQANTVIAVSPATARVLKKELRLKVRIVVIPNAIDRTQFATTPAERQQLRKKLNIALNDFVVLGCGQIQPRKRVDVFVKLAKQAPDIKFIWVGGTPFKRLGANHQQADQIEHSKLPNFLVTGVVPYGTAIEYFKTADAFLLPSEQETFGLVIIEAAAAGLPVVTRDLNEYQDTFGNDIIAVSEAAFLDRLKKLRDDSNYRSKAQHHSATLAGRYDNSAYARQVMDLYKSA